MSKKILWSEGLLLSQQHLQLWETLIQRQMYQISGVSSKRFGLHQLEINETLLENATISIRSLSGVMPNGVGFARTPSEPELRISSQALKAGQKIYLNISNTETVDSIPGYPSVGNQKQTAWRVVTHLARDIYDVSRVTEISLLEPNIYLSFEAPNPSAEVGFPIALIKSFENGRIILERNFLPPLLGVRASTELSYLLQQFHLKMHQELKRVKESLDSYNWSAHHQKRIIITAQATSLLASYSQRLKNLLNENPYPKQIFDALTELYSALHMLLVSDELTLPDFQNYQTYESWLAMVNKITNLFEFLRFDDSNSLQLVKESSQLYQVNDLRKVNLKNIHLVLKLKFDSVSANFLDEFSRQVKVSAKKDMASILASALPGIEIVQNTYITNQFPRYKGIAYYHLISEGPLWTQVLQENNLSLFLPERYADVQIELLAVAQ